MPPKKVSIANIQQIIQIFLVASSFIIFEAAALLIHITDSAHRHNNSELKIKREYDKGIDRIISVIQDSIMTTNKKKKRYRVAKKLPIPMQLPTTSSRLPYPEDGSTYNKNEIIVILPLFQNKTHSVACHITISNIIEKGLVTGCKSTIYAVLKRDRQGTPPRYKDFIK